MEQVLKYRNHIYGFCALWIIIFHINIEVGTYFNIPLLTPFIRLGNCGVDVFLFLSGYCLVLSYNRDSRIKNFYKKRFSRVLIPFLVIAIPFYIFKNITRPTNPDIFSVICGFFRDITGLSFILDGIRTTWYVFAILWLYILFPLIYRIISHSKKASFILLFVLYGFILLAHFDPLHHNYAIALTRFPVFAFGSIMAYYKIEIQKTKLTWAVFIFYTLVFMGLLPINDIVDNYSLPKPVLWMFFLTLVIPIIYILTWLFNNIRMDCSIMKSLLYIGNISLEIYMIHVMIINISRPYGIIPQVGLFAYGIVPITSLFLCVIIREGINRVVE